MNAYQFGMKYFNQTFQPSKNCVVFNDIYQIVDQNGFVEQPVELPFFFEQVKPTAEDKVYKRLGTPKVYNGEVFVDYLIPNGYVTVVPDNTLENSPNNFFSIYQYNDEFYVRVGDGAIQDQFDFVSEDKPPATPKFFGSTDIKLREFFENEDLSLVFFSQMTEPY